MDLFSDQAEPLPIEATDFDMKVTQFINRWCMEWNKEHARRELDELIDEAVRTQTA